MNAGSYGTKYNNCEHKMVDTEYHIEMQYPNSIEKTNLASYSDNISPSESLSSLLAGLDYLFMMSPYAISMLEENRLHQASPRHPTITVLVRWGEVMCSITSRHP